MWAIISTVVFDRKDFCDGQRDLLAIAKFLVIMSNTLSVHLSPWTTSFVLMTQIYFSYLLVHVTLIQAQLVYRLVRHISRTTVNLLTLNTSTTEFLLTGFKQLATKYTSPHSTLSTLLANLALSVMNTLLSVRTNLSARSRPCYTRKTSL